MAMSSTDVRSFFQTRAKYRTLTAQTTILILAGIAFAADMLVVYLSMGEARQIYGGVSLLLVGVYAFTPLIGWMAMTAVVTGIGQVVKARIRYGTLLRVTGWASIPLVGTGVSWSLGRYLALGSSEPCADGSFECGPGTYATIQDQVQAIFAYTAGASADPLFLGFFVVGLVFAVATAVLWVWAAEQVSTLTIQGAVVAAGIPASLLIALLVYLSVL
ncbi:YIP1 family protein [Haloarchaeobius sp. HME9146]|uniref:YIP1 family protein n=1 Tax=Haloarchaeobius sp. HME9146 TaxID=2978732 RepID=UPI0021C0A426|nr:YIP1 family protein [Haloarchaeobius sp. HME9146]MCT9098023.1 hypothetical protein [Haloarchaeobius sp. HME9146]